MIKRNSSVLAYTPYIGIKLSLFCFQITSTRIFFYTVPFFIAIVSKKSNILFYKNLKMRINSKLFIFTLSSAFVNNRNHKSNLALRINKKIIYTWSEIGVFNSLTSYLCVQWLCKHYYDIVHVWEKSEVCTIKIMLKSIFGTWPNQPLSCPFPLLDGVINFQL